MTKTIWVLGANGMLGSMVFDYLSQQKDLEVFGTVRDSSKDQRYNIAELDVNQPRALRDLWQTRMCGADYIINCIGAIKPRITEDTDGYLNAIRLNAELPHRLADLVDRTHTKVIHASTDCVFSGNDRHFYTEDSEPDPQDVYGTTKYVGESKYNMNIRVSIVGPELDGRQQSLYEWYMNADPRIEVKGFSNHTWNGITTLQWAKVAENIIIDDLWFPGTLHVSSPHIVSKHDLLSIFQQDALRRGIQTAPIKKEMASEDKFMCLRSICGTMYRFGLPPLDRQVREMTDFVENINVGNP